MTILYNQPNDKIIFIPFTYTFAPFVTKKRMGLSTMQNEDKIISSSLIWQE